MLAGTIGVPADFGADLAIRTIEGGDNQCRGGRRQLPNADSSSPLRVRTVTAVAVPTLDAVPVVRSRRLDGNGPSSLAVRRRRRSRLAAWLEVAPYGADPGFHLTNPVGGDPRGWSSTRRRPGCA